MSNDWHNLYHQGQHLTEEQLNRYVADECTDREAFEIERHTLECELCSDAIEGLLILKNRGTGHESALLVIQQDLKEGEQTKVIKFRPAYWAAAAAIAITIIGSFLLMDSGDSGLADAPEIEEQKQRLDAKTEQEIAPAEQEVEIIEKQVVEQDSVVVMEMEVKNNIAQPATPKKMEVVTGSATITSSDMEDIGLTHSWSSEAPKNVSTESNSLYFSRTADQAAPDQSISNQPPVLNGPVPNGVTFGDNNATGQAYNAEPSYNGYADGAGAVSLSQQQVDELTIDLNEAVEEEAELADKQDDVDRKQAENKSYKFKAEERVESSVELRAAAVEMDSTLKVVEASGVASSASAADQIQPSLLDKGKSLYNKGQYLDASTILQGQTKTLTNQKDKEEAHFYLAKCLIELNQQGDAKKHLEMVVKLGGLYQKQAKKLLKKLD